MTKKSIYFVVGNSYNPCGQEDFINAVNNIFDDSIYREYGLEMPNSGKVKVTLSQEVIPGEINIFMENFDVQFSNYLIKLKEQYPLTKYIVILTEFPTISPSGYVSFNSFTKAEIAWSMVVRLKNFKDIFPVNRIKEDIAVLSKLGKSKGGNAREFMRIFQWPLFFVFPVRHILAHMLKDRLIAKVVGRCLIDVSRQSDRLSYENRLVGLLRLRSTVSLFLVTHPKLVSMYSRLAFDPLEELPLLFSMKPLERLSDRPNAYFFSGNLTKYREKRLQQLKASLFGPYKQYGYVQEVLNLVYHFLSFRKIDEKKFRKILDDGLSVYVPPERIMELFEDLEKTEISTADKYEKVVNLVSELYNHYPPLSICESAYANTLTVGIVPRYEIYIPQSSNWIYSSPVRMFRSLSHGIQPVNFGSFSDHELTSIAFQAENHNELSTILNNVGENRGLVERLRRYHKKSCRQARLVIDKILSLNNDKIIERNGAKDRSAINY
jgi:hypothetical protein